jgi:molybdopterin-containing oxidoreductase family iron-sulfur binding subunit
VARVWERQEINLAADEQEKEEKMRGYRIFEELRTYPSVVYLERVRDLEA